MIHGKNNTQPEAPYYANIFNYLLSNDLDGYQEMDEITLELVHDIDGFLGYESQKSAGRGSFISYWRDKESIAEWRKMPPTRKPFMKELSDGIATTTRWW